MNDLQSSIDKLILKVENIDRRLQAMQEHTTNVSDKVLQALLIDTEVTK